MIESHYLFIDGPTSPRPDRWTAAAAEERLNRLKHSDFSEGNAALCLSQASSAPDFREIAHSFDYSQG